MACGFLERIALVCGDEIFALRIDHKYNFVFQKLHPDRKDVAMKADEEARAKMAAGMQMQQELLREDRELPWNDLQKMQEQQAQQQEMEERKRVMVRSILEPEALERLHRIGLVKPEKKEQVELMLIQQAQSGRISEKMTDAQLSQLMEKMSASVTTTSSVKIQRKRRDEDDDDIDLDNL
eukprot:s956_g15.t1